MKCARFQAELLHEIIPGAVVLHDFPGGGLGKHVDYSRVAKELDRAAYNNYPVWGGQREPLRPNEIAFGPVSYTHLIFFWMTLKVYKKGRAKVDKLHKNE